MNRDEDQEIRNLQIMLAAAVRSNGGKLIIYDSDIVQASEDEVSRYNDSANRRVVLTLYDDYPAGGVRNSLYRCSVCEHTAPELEWDEVWSHKQGGFIATSCPRCHAFRKTMCWAHEPNWMNKVVLSGLERAAYSQQHYGQAVPTSRADYIPAGYAALRDEMLEEAGKFARCRDLLAASGNDGAAAAAERARQRLTEYADALVAAPELNNKET